MKIQMNSEKVESWHGIIISPHIACAKKLRGLRPKLDALRVENGQPVSKYISGFHMETRVLQQAFHFFTCNCSDILD